MSATGSLTKFYGSFFLGAGEFALAPYLLTINAFRSKKNPQSGELILGVGMCIFLSTVVPVLPEVTAITMALAGFVMSLAIATAFFSYPIALLCDLLDECDADYAPPTPNYYNNIGFN